jgi:succinate dehydrogenase/fumarate reductase flavoprotein subunit
VKQRAVLTEERISTDVLVVGAGAGGMMAAISAADSGARVILCEKGNARRSGGIGGGNDHFVCYIPEIHGSGFRDHFIRENMSDLADEDLVSKFVDLSYPVLQKWESWGVNIKTGGHYEFTGHGWPGSSGKLGEPGKTDRTYIHFSDNNLCAKLEKQVTDRNIRIMNRVMLAELIKDTNGRVVGAVGIGTREPKLFVFQAKSIVINKGVVEAHRLYPPPYLIGYSMAQPGTGDGVMMAYRAGADVQNAEFCYRQTSLRFGPWAGRGTWIGVVRDSEGKPIAPPYLDQPDPEIGDPAIENPDALDHVWEAGKGPVWMDTRGITEEEERYMRWGFESEALVPFLRWLDHEKIAFRKTRFEFVTMQPRTNIHARVDANFKTTVEGLYAISPGFLSWSAVGGLIAGEAAAKEAEDIDSPGAEEHHDKIFRLKQRYEGLLNRDGLQFADWREAQWAIWQIMHCYALPPHRTESTLTAGYNHLLRLKELAYRTLKAGNQHDLCHSIEVLNLMGVAELVILAVIERKESRDQARRMDYPFTNPALKKFLVITLKDGKPVFRWEKPRRVSE